MSKPIKPVNFKPDKFDQAFINELTQCDFFDSNADLLREAIRDLAVKKLGEKHVKELTFNTMMGIED